MPPAPGTLIGPPAHNGGVRIVAALLAAAATSLALAVAPPAQAAPRFERCGAFPFSCARLSVPLDRSGMTPGRVSLFIKRIRAQRRPARGALFVLAGGPGQSATQSFEGDGVLSPAFKRRDVIVFDQRGTGRSGVLRCRALERSNLFRAGRAAGLCARRLGASRHHYTSRDSVEDIEAIRVALGLEKIALFGTSYGVKVALGYALAHPANVERLVLDSVVEPTGPDPLYRPTIQALPRVLRALCRGRCDSFTADPLADLARLVRRMGDRPLRAPVVDSRGRRRPARLTRGELFLMLISGDFDPALRAALPGAVRAALDGDRMPLLRLGRRSFSVGGEPPPPPRLISTALYAATTCEEMSFPWARTTAPDPAERRRQAVAAVAALPDSAFLPFNRGTVLDNDLLRLCDRWPALPTAPALGPGPLPDVPVLVLEGEDDLRTPVESAQRVAAQFPQAKLVVAPATGHSALGSDLSGCAERAFARFFRDQPVSTRCRRVRRAFPPTPPPPTALRRVPAARGVAGVRGRALTALALTLRDVEDPLTRAILAVGDSDIARGGGLRAGRYRVDGRSVVHLDDLVFVPGVRVNGRVRGFGTRRQRGRLRLSGRAAPGGVLSLRGRRVTGRLGGKRVRAVLSVAGGRRGCAGHRGAPPGAALSCLQASRLPSRPACAARSAAKAAKSRA